MRGIRKKKLTALFNELVSRKLIPAKDMNHPKLQWRRFKKMYLSGELWDIFPSM